MENIELKENEENELVKILSLLEIIHSAKKTKYINRAQEELRLINIDKLSLIKLIIKGLSITKIRNKEISLELHKSLLIYLKNFLLINQRYINNCDIYDYLCNIFNLMLTVTNNTNIQNESTLILLNSFVKTLCDNNNSMMEKPEYIEKLLKFILDKITPVLDNNFLYIIKNGLGLIFVLLSSKYIGPNNYLDFVQKYLIPTADIIFSKVNMYIIPNNNVYNFDYITILQNLYETFYMSLSKMKRFYPSLKRKETGEFFFSKYGKYTYELIQIIPSINKIEKNNYGNENPIIVFNEEYKDINTMKANAFKFINLMIQYSSMSSIFNNNENNNNNINNFDDKKNIINNQNIIDITSKLITLSIKSFENVLINEKLFYFLRKIDIERNDEENCYNILLCEIISFLSESLTKEPIKREFYQHIKLFLLNVLFPLLITIDTEEIYAEREPEEYCAYFNDLVYNFTLKNFRVAGFLLIKKLSEEYIDISNFLFSYIIGMFNNIMNKEYNNNISDQISNQYNPYYYYKSQNILFDKCTDEIKLDFCLLIFIIIEKQLLKYDLLKNKLREVLIKSKDKFEQIENPLINIKLCHFFKFVILNLFDKEIEDENKENIINNNMNKIIEDESNIKNKSFIEKALFILFTNLIQPKIEKELRDDLYNHSLANEASECIIFLFKYIQSEKEDKNNILKNKLIDLLQIFFHSLIDLINVINLYSFFSVIEQIIKYIKINNREDLFNCLDKLTKRFNTELDRGDINSQTYCPLYFSIISSFFNGVNKINMNNNNINNNKTELDLFNELFKSVLKQMENIFQFLYYENLVKTMIDYIKCFKGINEQCSLVLNSMFNIIENDRAFSLNSYNYVSTFLFYLDNNISNDFVNQEQLFETIIKIIEKAFSLDDDNYDFSNLYALLLTLQIFSKNMNLSEIIFKTLLMNSLKCFTYIFEKDEKSGESKKKKEKNSIILGIFALGYIFKPEQTHNILDQLNIIQKKEKTKLYEEIEFELFNFNKYIDILVYINSYDIENEILRKCLILGYCSILKIDILKEYLNNNKNIKVKLIKIFTDFILLHKNEEIKKRNKLMKDELKIIKNENGKYNFDDESETEEEEEEQKENILDNNINNILESNQNIKNSDEYQFFKETLDSVKKNDPESFNMLTQELDQEKIKQLEEIYRIKKLKVNYQGIELEIPRRIVNIKRNNF